MASFEVHWRPSTKKDLRGIPAQNVVRILEAVKALADDPLPYGNQKLAGAEQTYRIRVGDYRIIYEVLSSLQRVEIQRVRHRKDVYR
jgi:mRNA interferase RelE/StbE